MPITHPTGADSSFSAAGASAWNQPHTLPDSSEIPFVQSGTGASLTPVASTVQTEIRRLFVCPEHFGAASSANVSVDDAPYVMAAFGAAASQGKFVFLSRTYQINSVLALTSSHNNLRVKGFGRSVSVLQRGFNGTLVTYTGASGVQWHGVHLTGNFGTNTGKCFDLSGTCNDPVWFNCVTEGFSDAHINFQADTGKNANMLGHSAVLGGGQSDALMIQVSTADTGATIRKLECSNLEGYVNLVGALDFYVTGCQLTRVVPDSNTLAFISSTRWGNNNNAMTISGTSHITGCSFAGDITLDSNFTGTFVANTQSAGAFTDNSTSTNCQILHKPAGATYYLLGKNKLPVNNSSAFDIPAEQIVSPGDADATYNPGSSGNIYTFATAFTGNHTLTLNTTNAIAGMRVEVSRTGGDTGGPWTLALGATGTSLSAHQSAILRYTGSFWRVTVIGTAP